MQMDDGAIKVGFCVAYDWPLLAYSLPQVYGKASVICLSIDSERRSWAKKIFEWDQNAFNELLRSIDVAGKILVYEDDFHLPELTPAQNEVRQRRLMSEKMGAGGWHIQLDCDEYFLNFAGFVEFLRKLPIRKYKFNVSCQLITLFKKVNNGFLYVYPQQSKHYEFLQIASKVPCYEHGRRNGYFNVISDFLIVHQSWARSDEEIWQKLSNWGHVDDFNVQRYFDFWANVNAENFGRFRDILPMHPPVWPSLCFLKSKDIAEVIAKFNAGSFPKLHPVSRIIRNSILISRAVCAARRLYRVGFQHWRS